MNDWFVLVILVPLALGESGELAPWAARRGVDRAARMLGDREACERYREEWRADLDGVPGKLTKLAFAAGVILLSMPRLRFQAWRDERDVPGMRAACCRAMAAVDTAQDLATFASLAATGATCALGFLSVTVNLRDKVDMVAVNVIGSEELKREMLGQRCERAAIEKMLAGATPWGSLRFLDAVGSMQDIPVYVPPATAEESVPDAWLPEYGLVAPLVAAGGELLGTLSLDIPTHGRLPRTAQLAVVEAYARHIARRLEKLQQ